MTDTTNDREAEKPAQESAVDRANALLLEVNEGRVYRDHGPTTLLLLEQARELDALREKYADKCSHVDGLIAEEKKLLDENAALRANSLKPLSVMGRFELDLYAEQHEQLCKNLGVERISIVEAVEKVAALCAEVAALTKQLGECSGALESYRKQIDMLEVQAVNSIAPGWVSIPAVEWDSIMGPLATAEKERKHG